jgi:hypothetical protein
VTVLPGCGQCASFVLKPFFISFPLPSVTPPMASTIARKVIQNGASASRIGRVPGQREDFPT